MEDHQIRAVYKQKPIEIEKQVSPILTLYNKLDSPPPNPCDSLYYNNWNMTGLSCDMYLKNYEDKEAIRIIIETDTEPYYFFHTIYTVCNNKACTTKSNINSKERIMLIDPEKAPGSRLRIMTGDYVSNSYCNNDPSDVCDSLTKRYYFDELYMIDRESRMPTLVLKYKSTE